MKLDSWIWGPFSIMYFWASFCFINWGFSADHGKCWGVSGLLCCRALCSSTALSKGTWKVRAHKRWLLSLLTGFPLWEGVADYVYFGFLPRRCLGFFSSSEIQMPKWRFEVCLELVPPQLLIVVFRINWIG